MSEKSHVSMEQAMCPVCAKAHDTGAILLDRRLRPTLDRHTVTGWALCAADKAKIDEGYIPMVGVDDTKSTFDHRGNISPDGAWRTGKVMYMRRSAWPEVFNAPAPKLFCFVSDAVIDQLAPMATDIDQPQEPQ